MVQPGVSVATFLAAVEHHPENRQRSAHVQPHDPSKLGMHDEQYRIVSDMPDARPNNSFDPSDLTRTVKEAGLCDGAVLEQRESMMCD